ncbi:uncharacterized protein EV420DRAFT_1482717 [Desarmillaria tabescens]|uniref:Uncharacterized protein n=1 Tax=Armillaria tabescens TaxID=1929756 RepID=A0AA39MY62_ARMTA|nr:uncharacterized protein EV420DRAFT_1482717 [Desarmillaria tabescens]KAK0450513.1 hypothetical protein EV420DRAFT_1482717 [Desarmillaria tabescens]
MNDGRTKTMLVRRENLTTMTLQRGRELSGSHLSPATAFNIPSRAPLVVPVYGDEQQLTMTDHVRCHCAPSPDVSYTGSVHEYIAPSPLPALGKPCHRHSPLPSQTENDAPTAVHPLLRYTRGEMMMELDFAQSLSGVRVHGHEGCVNEAATNLPLPSLAIAHSMLP